MVNYKWIIAAMDVAVKEGQYDKVVKTVHWRYKGTDSETESIYYETFGAQEIALDDTFGFIPYEELTEENVVAWLEERLDVPALQNIISENIDKIKNPPIFTDYAPFEPKSEPIVVSVPEPTPEIPTSEEPTV